MSNGKVLINYGVANKRELLEHLICIFSVRTKKPTMIICIILIELNINH